MAFDISKLERLEVRPPGRVASRILAAADPRARYIPLTRFEPTAQGLCAWCNESALPPRSKKYCSETCALSAQMIAHPQCPGAKAYLFVRVQDCICPTCGEDFGEIWASMLERHAATLASFKEHGWYKQTAKITYHWLGSQTGDRWQVDHVVPIHMGGRGTGFENVQVICAPCHSRKTAREGGERASLRRKREGASR